MKKIVSQINVDEIKYSPRWENKELKLFNNFLLLKGVDWTTLKNDSQKSGKIKSFLKEIRRY